MASLEKWQDRPIEEANLFNPAFVCALVHEFLKDYVKAQAGGAPITVVVIAMTATLHRASRERLPNRTVTPLYAWIQDNEDLLIGFASRAKNIVPYVKEGILFGMATETVAVGKGLNLLPGAKKATFPKPFIDKTTAEMRSIIDRAKFMGRWLSNSGSEISVAAAWGVKP
ncbi:MAG: three component ABC system middle component [Pseudomonadota bacterium]